MATEFEPKSIHTWFNTEVTEIDGWYVDVKIAKFSPDLPREWLIYFGLQIFFTEDNEGAHGGLQWCLNHKPANKGLNWGGYPIDRLGVNLQPLDWREGEWYSYHVQKNGDSDSSLTHWSFELTHCDSGESWQVGTVTTNSRWIKNGYTFLETDGAQCDSPQVRVEWRNPRFLAAGREHTPRELVATYNGTCVEPVTNQNLISRDPLEWFQATNATRQVANNTTLWNA